MSPEPTEDVAPTHAFARTATVKEGFTGNRNGYAQQDEARSSSMSQFPGTRLPSCPRKQCHGELRAVIDSSNL
jgi:hypothetical protein